MGVLRDGRPRTFLVHPTARKSAWPFAAPRPLPDVVLAQPRVPSPGGGLGAKTVQLTDELRAHYGVPAGRGVLVVRVDERGVSRDAGIEVGDVVVEVGTQPVTTPLEVEVALARREPGVPLEIEVVRDRTTVVKRIPAAPPPMTRVPPAPRASEERVRSLERSIEVLERRLDELRRQLAEVKAESPDRQE